MFCPKCGKENKDGAKFCAGCGSALPGLQKDETVQSSQAYNNAEKYNTSEEVPHGGNIFAENPDRSLPPGVNPNQNGTSKKNSGKKKWIFIGAGAAALVIVVIAIILIFAGRGSVSEVEETQDEEYLEAAEEYVSVSEGITELTQDDDYVNSDTAQKSELMLELLLQLADEGLLAEDEIYYDEDSQIIWYEYVKGGIGAVMLQEHAENTDGASDGDGYVTDYTEDGLVGSFKDVVEIDVDGCPYEEEDLSALIIYDLGYDQVKEYLNNAATLYWPSEYLSTFMLEGASVETLRTLFSGYDLIMIREHGIINEDGQICIELSQESSFLTRLLYAAEISFTESDRAYIDDIQAERICILYTSSGENKFCLMPDFFTYYYGDGGLEDAIVWVGCCNGYMDDSLVGAIAGCGAKAVIGPTESVDTYYGTYMQLAFVYMLMYGNTVEDSLDFAKSVWGENDSVYASNYYTDYVDDTPAEFRIYNGGDEVLVTLTQEAQAAADTEAENIFAELPDTFTFTSGAGAWATELYINDDGTFTGYYHDSDMGDTGDGYSKGKMYICEFSGKFSDPVQVDEYTYSMELEYINIETEGDPYIEDEILYIPSDPYGMDDADEFLIYLPGSVLSELPEEFLDWFYLGSIARTTIPSGVYGLYNVSGMEGFTGETEDSIWGSDFEYGYGDNYSVMTPYYYCPSHIAFYDGTNEYGAIYLTFTWEEDDQTVFSASDSRGSGDYEIEIILNEEKTAAQITVISLDGADLSAYGGTSDGTLSAEYLLTQ